MAMSDTTADGDRSCHACCADEQLEDDIQTELSTLMERAKSFKSLHNDDDDCLAEALQVCARATTTAVDQS